ERDDARAVVLGARVAQRVAQRAARADPGHDEPRPLAVLEGQDRHDAAAALDLRAERGLGAEHARADLRGGDLERDALAVEAVAAPHLAEAALGHAGLEDDLEPVDAGAARRYCIMNVHSGCP